ncbi:MAG: hypothetical protein ER33_13335 [Cyanobium sp. CACIAM 14]|nr:MAG: hypothetical protein ER33_13335 [Cyanobium sp. CACIAM 14]
MALGAVAVTGVWLALPTLPAARGQAAWERCSFNGRAEDCVLAGGSTSFTITYRRDGKRIEMEKVGEPYSCGPADREECGRMLITEPATGRTTLATYRQTAGELFVRSARGNSYRLPRP